MIVKAIDTQITDDLLENGSKWSDRSVGITRAINSPKYTVIDWRGMKADDLDLSKLDDERIDEYANAVELINNKEILLKIYKHLDTVVYRNEAVLWNSLVDCHVISDELYHLQTYEENFNLYFKTIKFNYLPL